MRREEMLSKSGQKSCTSMGLVPAHRENFLYQPASHASCTVAFLPYTLLFSPVWALSTMCTVSSVVYKVHCVPPQCSTAHCMYSGCNALLYVFCAGDCLAWIFSGTCCTVCVQCILCIFCTVCALYSSAGFWIACVFVCILCIFVYHVFFFAFCSVQRISVQDAA